MEQSKQEIIAQIERMSEEDIQELQNFVEFLNWKKDRPATGGISERDRSALVPSVGGGLARKSDVQPSLTQEKWHQALEIITAERLHRLRASH